MRIYGREAVAGVQGNVADSKAPARSKECDSSELTAP